MTPRTKLRFRSVATVFLTLLSCALAAPLAAAGSSAKRIFDVPAGPAETALKRFSAQAGLQLVFAAELTDGVRTNEVRGELTPLEAADRMLAGTPLRVVHDAKTGVFSVTRQTAAEKNVPRVAQATPSERRPSHSNSTGANSAIDAAVTLSPFEVHAERDTGYAASGTLMGTRLNMELKDVAASVSAITKDFMLDVNANDMERLLVYTLGTEVAGMGGNFSNATDLAGRYTSLEDGNRGSTPATRLRGLGSADNTRDFFLSNIPMDGYIVDRVDISRGPNAMLFGLGAPAGVINSTLIKAETRQNKTSIDTQIGSDRTHRTSLDHNHVLIRDKLAVRVAGLYSDRRYRIEDAFRKDNRAFVAGIYRPFRGTTIKGNFEIGRADFNIPKNRPPLDNYTPWWDIGMPVFDPTTGVATLLSTPKPGFPSGVTAAGGLNGNVMNTTQFGDVGWRAAIVYSDPASSVPGVSTVPGAVAIKTRGDRVRVNAANGQLVESAMATLAAGVAYQRYLHRDELSASFWRWPTLNDPRIFDFYHYHLDGPNNDGYTKWHAFNTVIEQRAFQDRLGIEVAYDYQDMQHMTLDASLQGQYTVFLDINTKLLDGSPNPNLGRPVFASSGNHRINDTERRAARATAYYNIDLRKVGSERVGRILGRHTLTASFTDQEIYTFSRSGPPIVVGTDYEMFEYGSIAAKTSASRRMALLAYIGPSMIGTTSPTDRQLQPISARLWPDRRAQVPTLSSQPPPVGSTTPNPWAVRPFSIVANAREAIHAISGANKHRDKFESGVLVLTNRWLDDKVISFLSWRRDEYESSDAGGAPLDTSTGSLIVSPHAYRLAPANSGGASKFNYGITAHAPEFVRRRLPLDMDFSVYYNASDNFRPQAQRYDLFNQPIDAESGTTKEYGLRLSFLRGKFELRATRYETASTLATETGLGNGINALPNRVEALIEQLDAPGGFYQTAASEANPDAAQRALYQEGLADFDAWLQTPAAKQLTETFQFQVVTNANGGKQVTTSLRSGEVVATTDTVSKGYELEAIFNPTRSWRISFNANQQEAVKANTGRSLRRMVDEAWTPLVNSAVGDLRSTQGGASATTVREESQATVYQPLRRVELLDGSRTPEIREWNWRGTTSYTFREGFLKNWRIGGSVRWMQGGVIGYPVIADPSAGGAIINITRPYFSPSEATFDAFVGYSRRLPKNVQWSVRFHVRNLGIGNELIPVQANPDGSVAAYRIREPQTWTLSNSFSF